MQGSMIHPLARGPGRRRGLVIPLSGRVLRTFESATHERRAGLDILHLRGTPFEMGRQHGTLLKQEIRDGIFDYYLCCIARVVERSNARKSPGFLSLIGRVLRRDLFARFIRDRLLRHVPPAMLEEFRGISEGAGLSLEQTLRSAIVGDLLLYLLGRMFRKQGVLAPHPIMAACTSIAAWGGATSDGRLLHGRNLEFWGVGKWDAHPTALVCEPDAGLRYVSITTAGVGTGGITSMNETGLTVALNIVPARDVSLDGAPVVGIVNEVVRRAETIDDAVKVASELPSCAGFALMLSEARGRKAAVLEVSASRKELRLPEGDTLVQTNHYVHPLMVPFGIEVNSSVRLHTLGRYVRAQQLLAASRGTIDEAEMAEFLGDHVDPVTGKERAVGNIVAQVNNISSMVFAPEQREVWVAVGPSPASHNRFLCLRLDEELNGGRRSEVVPYCEGSRFSRGPRNAAFRSYMDAYVRFEEKGDALDVLPLLEEAVRLDPEEPSYAMVCGVMNLKVRRFPEAVRAFERAIEGEDLPHKSAVARFWKGIAHRFLGDSEAAEAEFERVRHGTAVGRDLQEAVNDHQYGIESAEDLEALDVDFIFTDVFRAE